MVFNIASAALIYQDYLQSGRVSVTYTEYALSITELALVCFNLVGVAYILKKVHISMSLSLLVVQIFNIVYSAFMINYYKKHDSPNTDFINMSLAIIILNSLVICGCIGGSGLIISPLNITPLRNLI